jgi:phage N-6-adenine-methyltransferase
MVSKVMFSSKKQDWKTPPELFNKLDEIFCFSLDCASADYNNVCRRYRSAESPPEWSAEGETALWLNPPFQPAKLCRKLVEEVLDKSDEHDIPCAILLPARTDTRLWQEVIFPRCVVLFLRGRLQFVGASHGATFPTAICFGYKALMASPDEITQKLQEVASELGYLSMTIDFEPEES